MDNIRLLYIDLFCGAGGTSTGVEKANYKERKCAKVIACVNHDANAIASHAANHPEAQHYTEDMRTLDLRPLAEHTAECAECTLWRKLCFGLRLNVPISAGPKAASPATQIAVPLPNTCLGT